MKNWDIFLGYILLIAGIILSLYLGSKGEYLNLGDFALFIMITGVYFMARHSIFRD